MKIQTGQAPISLFTLIAIWSISLVVNLPGLAISPILSSLEQIFPKTSQLEIQMLTILPNLFIIPFVLLSGRFSVSKNKVKILVIALIIYSVSGALYLVAQNMTQLIIVSCLLGIGCGLCIPLAAGLVADFFTGKYRMKQLGIKSAIANLALVGATFVVGWLSDINWHMPFLVYLIPIVPLLLTPFLRHSDVLNKKRVVEEQKEKIDIKKLSGIMGLYGFISYAVVAVSYYLPFLMGDYHLNSENVSVVTAILFMSIMLPGFFLPAILRLLKQNTIIYMLVLMALGMAMTYVVHTQWLFCVAAVLIGGGYGAIQPLMYDRATETSSSSKNTLALSMVLTMNYVGVMLAPFIVDLFKMIFHVNNNKFPFILNSLLIVGVIVLSVFKRKAFVFSVQQDYL